MMLKHWIPLVVGGLVGIVQVWCVFNELGWVAVVLEWISRELEESS